MAVSPQGIKQRIISSGSVTYIILASRLVLFLLFQSLIALLLGSWETSEKHWLLTATLANIVSMALLFFLFRLEGDHYFSIFSFSRIGVKKDLLISMGLVLLSLPVIFLPGIFLGEIIWGDPNVPTAMMFGPVNKWLVYILLIAFPVTIAFAELATYFVYVMPRLKKQMKVKWLAVLLPVVFLSIQHCTLPFIPDFHFILYRALVFLPFAILIGVSIHYRPSLFVYFAVFHGMLDFGTAMMFLLEIR